MEFFILNALLLVAASSANAGCTKQQRIQGLMNITNAANEKNPVLKTQKVFALNLQEDCPVYVTVNGSPRVQTAYDATSSKVFTATVLQAFANVDAKYTDFNNGTALMDSIVTLGPGVVALPVKVRVLAYIPFNKHTCQIEVLPALVFAPVDVAGNPINPPQLPKIPGLATIPGFKEIMDKLAPALAPLE